MLLEPVYADLFEILLRDDPGGGAGERGGYWRKMPSVKRLVFTSIPEATTRVAMLKRGDVDIAYMPDESLSQTDKNDPNLKLAFSGGVGTFFLDFFDMWNPKSPWAEQR